MASFKRGFILAMCTNFLFCFCRQLDGLILINFFAFFVVSFVAGLLFLYSTVSLWTFQVCTMVKFFFRCGDSIVDNILSSVVCQAYF